MFVNGNFCKWVKSTSSNLENTIGELINREVINLINNVKFK